MSWVELWGLWSSVWTGSLFSPATEMYVDAVLTTTQVHRALHRRPREASPGQEGAQAYGQAAGPLPGPCSDPDLLPTNVSVFHSHIFNEWLKKPFVISTLSVCKSVLQR